MNRDIEFQEILQERVFRRLQNPVEFQGHRLKVTGSIRFSDTFPLPDRTVLLVVAARQGQLGRQLLGP